MGGGRGKHNTSCIEGFLPGCGPRCGGHKARGGGGRRGGAGGGGSQRPWRHRAGLHAQCSGEGRGRRGEGRLGRAGKLPSAPPPQRAVLLSPARAPPRPGGRFESRPLPACKQLPPYRSVPPCTAPVVHVVQVVVRLVLQEQPRHLAVKRVKVAGRQVRPHRGQHGLRVWRVGCGGVGCGVEQRTTDGLAEMAVTGCRGMEARRGCTTREGRGGHGTGGGHGTRAGRRLVSPKRGTWL